MKVLLISFLMMLSTLANTDAPALYDSLLKKYVSEDGVGYKEWHGNAEDMKALQQVVHYYAETDLPKDKKEALAFHLNAYNAWILERILHKYPTKGPISGGDLLFFHKKNIKVAGKKMSFDKLEQKIIRPVYQESRIHFALNCASVSCPPLRPERYDASRLDEQLNEQAYKFVRNSSYGVKLTGNKAEFSKIFKWYAEDFGGVESIPKWVRYYRELPELESQSFMDYDWSLNER